MILNWYQESARPLPWRRKHPDPYQIWISEVMSQQSTLKMMLPFFDRWMKSFPRISDLAAASEEKVLKHWEGLGYYSRARNIHKAAKILAQKFPQEPVEILKVPGIGPYTAAAISAIAFDFPTIPIDGNVTRVLARLFKVDDPLNNKKDFQQIKDIAQEFGHHIPKGKRGDLAQAFMEFGAMICRPGVLAKCEICPLQKDCWAFRSREVDFIPRAKLRPEMQKISRLLIIYRNNRGEILLRKIPTEKVLGGQWEIPHLDLDLSDEWITKELAKHFEVKKTFRHTIMHRTYSHWGVEAGLITKTEKDHAFLSEDFSGVLTTATRKFILSAQAEK